MKGGLEGGGARFVFEEGLVLPEYIIEFDYLGGPYGRGGVAPASPIPLVPRQGCGGG